MAVHSNRQVQSCIRGDPCNLVYRVDRNDRIVYVDDKWSGFARSNGGRNLGRETVLHHPLWDYLSGEETQSVYRTLLECARRENRVLRLPLRCDAPGIKRFMELYIRPLGQGAMEFATHLRRAEYRYPLRLLDASAERKGDPLLVCTWCKRISVTPHLWLETEKAVRELNLSHGEAQPPLVHVICPLCREAFQMCFGLHAKESRRGKTQPRGGEAGTALN